MPLGCHLRSTGAVRLRRSHLLAIIGAVLGLLGAAVTANLGFFALPFAAHAQETATPRILPASTPPSSAVGGGASTSTASVAATLYIAKRGESLGSVVRQYLPQTSYMTSSELEAALRAANSLRGLTLKPGQQLVIPGVEPPIIEKPIPVQRDFEARAIYLTGAMAASPKGLRIVERWRQSGGNSVVFDIKDSDGIVNIPFDHALNQGARRPAIRNLPKLVRYLHSKDLHAIARLAIFRDERLVRVHPELAAQSRRTGGPWRENGQLVWTDPSNSKVQEFDIALALAAAQAGVDEVQFDYVRFPAEGEQKDVRFAFQSEHPRWQRSDVIAGFLKDAYTQLHPTGVLLSLDVFGVMAWQRPVDLSHTGQDIPAMAQYCDVLSPMIYPSHFFGMDGYAHPGDAPEHFIGVSMERFVKITASSGVVLRPWLQAFAWRTKTYSTQYIVDQVKVARAHGGDGFLFWNARNDYAKPYLAMTQMGSTPGRYYRGDQVRSATAAARKPATPVLRPASLQ
jgi:hypothetical protein